jgi:hypothetical protein
VSKPITFHATFYKATTTADGGWRVYLDLSEGAGPVVARLAAAQGQVLQCAIMPEDECGGTDGEDDE